MNRVFSAVVVLLVVSSVFVMLDNGDVDRRVTVDECESGGGYVYNSNSVYHGGLHCGFENGTTAHIQAQENA